MNQYGATKRATHLAACPRDGENIHGPTKLSSFSTKTYLGKEGQPVLDQYMTSEHRKQILTEQESLQE